MTTLDERPDTRSGCFRCGYSLVGIADEQPCPECGLLAQRSRQIGDELHLTRPRWLRRMALGIWLILFALLWPAIWIALSSSVLFALSQMPSARRASWTFYSPYGVGRGSTATSFWEEIVVFLIRAPQAGFIFGTLALIAGCACFARREGFDSADRADRWRRIWLLVGSVVPTIALLLWIAATADRSFIREPNALPELLAVLLGTIGCLPLPVLLFFQLRSLAKRARIAQLAEHCAIVGIGVCIALLYTAGVYAEAEYPTLLGLPESWMSNGQSSLLLLATLLAVALMFYLWGLTLLVQFSLAFRRASKQLAAQWKRDDRALG